MNIIIKHYLYTLSDLNRLIYRKMVAVLTKTAVPNTIRILADPKITY